MHESAREAPRPVARYFRTPASRLPMFAPPDFVTKFTSTGTAFITSSGFRPSALNADAAPARLPSPAAPASAAAPDALDVAGAAFSKPAMPGTAPDTFAQSAGLSLP